MVLNSSGTTGPILLNSRFYRYFMWLNLGKAALMVVSNLMLIPKLGIVGAALGTFITSLVGEVYSAGLIWRRLKLQPISKQWAMALGLVGGLTAFNALLPAPDARVWLVLGGKVLFTLLLFVAFVVWGRISPDLIGIFNQWLGIIGIRLPGEEASKPGPAGKTKDQTHA
jgi:O-antigen/teichoic acid export membrane protein